MKRVTPEEKAERAAEKKAATEAYIASILKDWPPLTEHQKNVIGSLLGPGSARAIYTGPSAYELAERKKLQERDAALKAAKKAALSLTACDVCNLQPEVHHIRRGQGISMHEWQPGRAEKLMAK